MSRSLLTRSAPLAALALTAVLLSACGAEAPQDDPTTGSATDEPTETTEPPERETAEVAALAPRLALTYDGGILVLDATTLEVVGDLSIDGFNRLNPAGDGRHLLVSTSGGFQLLDAGAWAEGHGDHAHYYTTEPALTDVVFEAQTPGHVVSHGGRTALFDDGTGDVIAFDAGAVSDPGRQTRTHTAPEPHHGVAVELTEGTLLVSLGDADSRTGLVVLDAEGAEVARSEECPGLHDSAVAAGEAVVVGCHDGALIYAAGELTKVTSPDDDGGIGTLAGAPGSHVVLGNYNGPEDLNQVSLIDTRTGELTLVDLPTTYTSRSLALGPDGEALVLGADGELYVIDAEAGEIVETISVLDAWEVPEDWQEPRPVVFVLDGSVYITDPATQTVYAVDVPSGEVWNSVSLSVVPNDLSGVTGDLPAVLDDEGRHDDHDRGDHDHDDDDHDHDHDEDDHDHDHDDHDHDDHDGDHDHDH